MDELQKAKVELGEEEYNRRIRTIFGIKCLDFVKTIVINLPYPCYANCEYCIDHELIKSKPNTEKFIEVCKKTFEEFPNIQKITIAGGSLPPNKFNELIKIIVGAYSNVSITWNTNGVMIDEAYFESVKYINHVNLHRNAVSEEKNKEIFKAVKPIITLKEAKSIFGDKLNLRVTVDTNFNLDEYASLGIPLCINKMLPNTKQQNEVFSNVLKKLNISEEKDRRRRNVYLTADYKNIPVRVCMGDELATHVSGRKPTYLNVVIIHRSGIVCGSWYEDDKLLYRGGE